MTHHPYSTQEPYGDPEQFEEFIADDYPSRARHGDRHPPGPRPVEQEPWAPDDELPELDEDLARLRPPAEDHA